MVCHGYSRFHISKTWKDLTVQSIPQIQKSKTSTVNREHTIASCKANERSVLLFTLLSSAWPSHLLLEGKIHGSKFWCVYGASYPKQQPTVEEVGLRSTFFLQFLSQRPNRQLSHLNLKESSIAEKLRCVLLSKESFMQNHFLNANRRKGLSKRSFFYPLLFTLIV